MKPPSPLLGYNTNVRHRGRVYHIQTEDSGRDKPHVITHLFADGGRIVASRKTGYAEHLDTAGYPEIVKQLMQDQHKALFIALRSGEFDASEDAIAAANGGASPPAADAAAALPPPIPMPSRRAPAPVDVAALERAASRLSRGGYAAPAPVVPPRSAPPEPRPAGERRSFAADLVSEKSLDEVILGYLAEELDEP